jgi:ATP-dependent DNA helicase Rep
MSRLNPPQQAAVRHTGGPLLVLAGAGSGKTSVITHKIAWLIREHGLAPESVTAVTFTNKAAREMKTRITALLGKETAGRIPISTFHTLGLRILRAHLSDLGYRPGFSIHDADDSQNLIARLLRAENVARSQVDAVRYRISRWKNDLVVPAQATTLAALPIELLAARVYADYDRHLQACNAFDFDDLIRRPAELFHRKADVLAHWREQVRYLLVDEYQDTNLCQYELVRLLTGDRGAFTVVGDDDQSIYGWRGAHPENLARLSTDYPSLTVIKLEQNYRSTGRILRAANTLIANNPHVYKKALWSASGEGEPLRVLSARDEEHEAERVVGEIQYHRHRHRGHYRDYAILFRENHQARALERVLREQRIPYRLSGASSFFDRGEVKDILAYLRLLTNPDDDSAFLRIVNTPRREIGPATLETLAAHAGETGGSLLAATRSLGLASRLGDRPMARVRAFSVWLDGLIERVEADPPADILRDLLADLRYDEWLREIAKDDKAAQSRYENVLELIDWVKRLTRQGEGQTLSEAITRLTVLGMLDADEPGEADEVSLMTLHSAKGLEFPHVFLVGFEEGILPHRNSMDASNHARGASGPPPTPGDGQESKRGRRDSEARLRSSGRKISQGQPGEGMRARGNDPIEEERRLAYVGITRARQSLTLSLAGQRRRGGEMVTTEPSRFLAELPEADLAWNEAPTAAVATDRGHQSLHDLRKLLNAK